MGRKLRAEVTLSPTYLSLEPGGGNKSYFGCWPNRQESGQVPVSPLSPELVRQQASPCRIPPPSKHAPDHQACQQWLRVALRCDLMTFGWLETGRETWPGMGARAKWARSVPCQVRACHGGRSGPVAPQNLWTVNFSFQWRKEAGRAVRLRLGGRSGVESPLQRYPKWPEEEAVLNAGRISLVSLWFSLLGHLLCPWEPDPDILRP